MADLTSLLDRAESLELPAFLGSLSHEEYACLSRLGPPVAFWRAVSEGVQWDLDDVQRRLKEAEQEAWEAGRDRDEAQEKASKLETELDELKKLSEVQEQKIDELALRLEHLQEAHEQLRVERDDLRDELYRAETKAEVLESCGPPTDYN